MRGMLADTNVQGQALYLRRVFESLGLRAIFDELGLSLATFADVGLARDIDDRSLWQFCQEHGWVLFTENRNHDGPDSLGVTVADSWCDGCLPVLTLSNKSQFEHSREYAVRVAEDVAELLFGIAHQEYRDQPRIFVPR